MTTQIDFTGVPTSELVQAHNDLAEALGHKPVARFADRATAEKRTRLVLSMVDQSKRPGRWGPQADADGEHHDVAPGVGTKAGDPAVAPPREVPGDVGANPGPVPAVGEGPAKPERQQQAAREAIDDHPQGDTPPTKADAPKLPIPSSNPAKDAEMPALRRALKPLNLAPKKTVYARKAGSKQATLVDMLSRPEGATFGELYDAMAAAGTPWKGVTIRSGLAWDMNHVAGYGISSEAFDGLQFAEQGRDYEAIRLGVVWAGASQPVAGPSYDPSFKLLVYRLAYPAGQDAPVPHAPRKTPTEDQKAAAKRVLEQAVRDAEAGKA